MSWKVMSRNCAGRTAPAMLSAPGPFGRWRPLVEAAFWLAALATALLLPRNLLLLNEIAILALFALSLDLVLGYAGIVSLGHAAFFGAGAYAAGLLARHAVAEPFAGLLVAAGVGALLGFVTSFLVLRGSDLTRLMVTMAIALMLLELANRLSEITGGADGLQGVVMAPVLGLFAFDLAGRTACLYSLAVCFVLFMLARRLVRSPFGFSLRAIRSNRLRAVSLGVPADRRLVAIYTLAAAYAGVAGGLLAQTTQFVSLDVLDFHRSADVLLVLVIGGTGWLYGGVVGAVLFRVLQDWLAGLTPQYWHFWLGLFLVAFVLAGRERLFAGTRSLLARACAGFAGSGGRSGPSGP